MTDEEIIAPLTNPHFDQFSPEDRQFMHDFFQRHPKVGKNFSFYLALPDELRPRFAKSVLWDTPRSGWVRRQVKNPEDIDTHCVDLADIIAGVCQKSLFGCQFDEAAIKHMRDMARVHDFSEAIVTDFTPHDPITAEDKDRIEKLTAQVLFESPKYARGKALANEYIEQATPASHIVHDFDKFHPVIKAYRYEQNAPKKHAGMCTEFKDYTAKKLKTPQGKAMLHAFNEDPAQMIQDTLTAAAAYRQERVERGLQHYQQFSSAIEMAMFSANSGALGH